MSRAYQAYVIIGATGERVNSDRIVVSDTCVSDPKWVRTEEFMTEMFANFSKMDTLSVTTNGTEREFKTDFLVSAGMDVSDTDEEPTHSDEELLNSITEKNIDILLERLRS